MHEMPDLATRRTRTENPSNGRLPSMSRTARSAASESSAASINAATSMSPAMPAWQSSHSTEPPRAPSCMSELLSTG